MQGAKPFLKWAGGKRQLIPAIQSALPDSLRHARNLTYVEPFIGGGAVLFWMLQAYPNIRQAIINDVNPDLTTAYQVIQQRPQALIKALSAIQEAYRLLPSEAARRAYFEDVRTEFNTRPLEAVRNTAVLMFLNRTCFNGLYRVNSKGGFNVPFGRYDQPVICHPQTILANSKLLSRVTILQGDFAQVLNHTPANSFFYLDPPYKPLSKTAAFNAYATETFDAASQERLAAFCHGLDARGHQWLLSNSDPQNTDAADSYFDDLYAAFTIRRVQAKRHINSKAKGRGKISELLISNYAPTPEAQFA
ncbi:DNA adenine methylase [Hymenobacter sp. BT662]|uniref:site-specific DNA-methyltransferase (adenine-specific) n=2 Tax=Hymenobacter ruricola TaxID=2791023 RepID=A0ABS0I520_9BACT|nr:DNA adenine methylase [Hymenobacter ruricola]